MMEDDILCAIFDSEPKEVLKYFSLGAFRQIIRLIHSHNPSERQTCLDKEKK